MKTLVLFCCILGFSVVPAIAAEPVASPVLKQAEAKDRVMIQSKTVQLVRGKSGQDYPNYKKATIKYPQVTGLSDAVVLRKVQDAISLKTVFDSSVEEFREEFETQSGGWLSEISFKVNYNKNFLLDITFTQNGVGAYPSSFNQEVVVDLRTGKTLVAADIFKSESLNSLATMVNQALRSRMLQRIEELQNSRDPDAASFVEEQLGRQSFRVRHLDRFSVSDQGITFIYEYGFPHVALGLAPSGRFFFTYQQLKPYLKSEGVLSAVLRSR
jgi:hypothetical protein